MKKIFERRRKICKKNNRKFPPRFGRASSNLKSPYPKGRAAAIYANMVIRIWPTRKLGLDFDLEIDSRSCVISWLRVVITCRINVIVPCSFFLLLSGNLQIIFGLAISPHCLQTISKYFGNFYFYEAVTLTLKKRLLDRNSIKSNFRRQKHQNFWIYDTKHGRHIFEKK